MSLSTKAADQPSADNLCKPVALSVTISRNMIVQGLGLTMVALMGLTILPVPVVATWIAVAITVVMLENHLLRVFAAGPLLALDANRWVAALRILTTAIYASAAYALIMHGGLHQHLFAFALVSASMVHVLMRHYRSPLILLASFSPYIVVLGFVTFEMSRSSLLNGHPLAALAPLLTVGILAVQFWSARAQLAASWSDLTGARDAAEERGRAAVAANRAKSEFLSNMSHELRTPLNGVLGMAQALSGERLSDVQQERVTIIRRSSEGLLSVLNDLLDLSKIEAQTLELEIVDFDLEEIVAGVAIAFQPLAEKKALSFVSSVAPEARGLYGGDSARIRRILYSLVDNAVKFTDRGGVRLEVVGDAHGVAFRVIDTGIGISDAYVSHLFEGFYQGDASFTRRHGGAGIGLALCRQLTDLMGGAIEMSSEVGRGSVFTVTLPLERLAVQVPEAPAAPAIAGEEETELRVLAAEDNPTNQLVLKALLGAVSIEPTFADNGHQAVALWESKTWDIVLMDIQMPEMNGVEATRAIRLSEAQTGRRRTPIVAVTANAMIHQLAEYEDAGMDGVVPKPVDLPCLIAAIERALGASEDAAPSSQSAAG